jgi:hypothetical protein
LSKETHVVVTDQTAEEGGKGREEKEEEKRIEVSNC